MHSNLEATRDHVPTLAAAVETSPSNSQRTARFTNDWPRRQLLLAAVAATAAAVGLLRLCIAFISLRYYRRTSVPIEDVAVHDLLSELSQRCGVRPGVALRESPLAGHRSVERQCQGVSDSTPADRSVAEY